MDKYSVKTWMKAEVIYRIAISKSWFLVATQCNNFWINDIPMLGNFNINFQNSTARDIVLHDGFMIFCLIIKMLALI